MIQGQSAQPGMQQMYAIAQTPPQTVLAMPVRGSVRAGHVLVFLGAMLVGVGVMIIAFSLGSISVTNMQMSGGYTGPPSFSFSVGISGFTIAMILIGIGYVLRAIGALLASWF